MSVFKGHVRRSSGAETLPGVSLRRLSLEGGSARPSARGERSPGPDSGKTRTIAESPRDRGEGETASVSASATGVGFSSVFVGDIPATSGRHDHRDHSAAATHSSRGDAHAQAPVRHHLLTTHHTRHDSTAPDAPDLAVTPPVSGGAAEHPGHAHSASRHSHASSDTAVHHRHGAAHGLHARSASGVSSASSHSAGTGGAESPLPPPPPRTGHHHIESASRSRALRRSSLTLADSSLVQSVLQRAASEAGAGPKLGMLRKALDDASDANGYVDFPAFAAAMSAFLEIDDNALLMSYFRGMKPVVHSDRVLTRIARLTDGTVRDAIAFAFSCFDADGDGFVEASDFVSLVQATVTARMRRRGSAPTDYDRLRTQLTALFLAERRDWGATKMSLAEFEDFVLRHEGELVAACEGTAPAAGGSESPAGAAGAGSGTTHPAASAAMPTSAPGGTAAGAHR